MNNQKRKNSLVFLLVCAGLLRCGSGLQAQTNASATGDKVAAKVSELFPDKVLAKGKGLEIKRNEFDQEVIRQKAQWAGRGQAIPAAQMSQFEQAILEQMIDLQLLLAKATDADKAAGKAQAEENFTKAKAELGSEEMLAQRLKAEGFSKDQLLARWADGGAAQSVLKRELKVDATDADAKKFYDDNPSDFEHKEMVRASHILLRTQDSAGKDLTDDQKAAKRKQMEDLLKRARAGEDFAKLAKEYSEDPGSKDKGGEYTFPRGMMAPEFEAAAFSLNTNQISDIVTTQFGYHIIKLSEKIPAQKEDFTKVAPKIKEFLLGQNMQKQMPAYMKKLQKEAGVEILDDSLKPTELPDATAPTGLPAGHPPVKN